MKKNKSTLIFVMVLILILIFLLIFGYNNNLFFKRFDIDKDVCLKCEGYNEYGTKISASSEVACKNDGLIFHLNDFKCLTKRPKNFCELNCENKEWNDECEERCNCDKYEPFKRCWYVNKEDAGSGFALWEGMNTTKYPPFICEDRRCLKAHPKPKPIKINLDEEKCIEHTNDYLVSNQDVGGECSVIGRACEQGSTYGCEDYDKYCCLKKEKKNPCDKGDEDWVLEEKEVKAIYKYGTKEYPYVELKTPCIDTPYGIVNTTGVKCHIKICREKNECEKNNPFFVWDIDLHKHEYCIMDCGYGNPNITIKDCDILCAEAGEICRKKTLHDWDCEQLLRWVENKDFQNSYSDTELLLQLLKNKCFN